VKSQRHLLIISIVSVTIIATIGVQVYWNYLNYSANRIELKNQVQVSLDKAVEQYYADIARGHSFTFMASTDSAPEMNQIRHMIQDGHDFISDTLHRRRAFRYSTSTRNLSSDTIIDLVVGRNTLNSVNSDTAQELHFNRIDTSAISLFASKVFTSMQEDSIEFSKIKDLIRSDFDSKNWPIAFGLSYKNPNCALPFTQCDTLQTYGQTNVDGQLIVTSKSALISLDSELEIHFSNISSILLKQSSVGILLSLLLSAAIIFCLLYLIRTINEQKQLAEIKNDLISNITHEFKTPITTIGTALEGILNFQGLEDIEKTKKYIGISNSQLKKLDIMVEKLLETASIDSEHLELNLDQVNLTDLIQEQLDKYKISHTDKSFSFVSDLEEGISKVDVFHIEGAIGNLLDNAVKYGGESIKIHLSNGDNNSIKICVIDNGEGISTDQHDKIFDKFYRIPTGNVHDVKGFGIGLYYARNIVEKHGGKLELVSATSKTSFEITLPYVH
jgi:signal transduction histidine kinase